MEKTGDFSSYTDWLEYDRDHIWHPYTSMTRPLPTYPVASAQGVTITLADGTELIDGMSSWWAAIHGYNHPVLNAAIENQLKSMSHVMFGGLTHLPAVSLAKKLVDITAEPLQHVFFSDSGSVAVEVAIKMALQYWHAQGKTAKQRLLTVRNGYHGDTFGTMAVCDPVNGMHNMFAGVLPQHLFAPAPECRDSFHLDHIQSEPVRSGHIQPEKNQPDSSDPEIEDFERLIRLHHTEIAAIILEPVVQGAGGMRFYCPEYVTRVREYCDRYDVLLILDEIATGFGRTGTLFAYEQAGIYPDILCIGKALTGGMMTLAATLTSSKVVQGISADGHGVLMHGPTFMANPLACSVANASIDLLLTSDWQKKVHAIEKQLEKELSVCNNLPAVNAVRVKGAIGVVELHEAVDLQWMQRRFVEAGVWIRPFNKLVYIMPPYIIEADKLSQLTGAIYSVLAGAE